MITISAAGSIQAFHDEFERMLRLSTRASEAFERAFHRRLGISREEGIDRFDSVAHPLPPEVELLIVHDEDAPGSRSRTRTPCIGHTVNGLAFW